MMGTRYFEDLESGFSYVKTGVWRVESHFCDLWHFLSGCAGRCDNNKERKPSGTV
jgi:hypothetical protein